MLFSFFLIAITWCVTWASIPIVDWEKAILLRYNSLPCGTECFTGCREELWPTSKKKRHLLLAVASGFHVFCPFVSTFLVGRRHFTVFGKYLLPFSSYISMQFYCYTSLFMYFIYYCIKHIPAKFQHFRLCNLSLFWVLWGFLLRVF